MLMPFLLSQVFVYCTGNPIYDAPNGNIMQFYDPIEMINITHIWLHHQRDPFRIKDWVEVYPVKNTGWIIDRDKTYWMRMDGCWGERVGV